MRHARVDVHLNWGWSKEEHSWEAWEDTQGAEATQGWVTSPVVNSLGETCRKAVRQVLPHCALVTSQ
jgi:hypothetical protein